MDEVFESLVLIQTGKSPIVPVVLVEGQDGDFWQRWEDFTKGALLKKVDQPRRPRLVPNCVFARRSCGRNHFVLPGVPVRPLRARQVGAAVDSEPDRTRIGHSQRGIQHFDRLGAHRKHRSFARRRRSHPPSPVGLPPHQAQIWSVNSSIASTVLMLRDSDCCPSGFGKHAGLRPVLRWFPLWKLRRLLNQIPLKLSAKKRRRRFGQVPVREAVMVVSLVSNCCVFGLMPMAPCPTAARFSWGGADARWLGTPSAAHG